MILQENYTLSNGVEIPKLGLGTWFINDAGLWWETESEINVLNGMAFHPQLEIENRRELGDQS